jgi:hypothetical protein
MFLKNQSCIFIHLNTCTSAKKINNTFNKKAMKNSRILRMLFYLIFITVISSCNSDDNEINQGEELLGVWELSSSNDSNNYQLYFYEDNIGGESGGSSHSDGTAMSFFVSFTWSTTDNPKTLIIPDMELNSPYSINAEGQLIINNFRQGEPFNKLDSSN